MEINGQEGILFRKIASVPLIKFSLTAIKPHCVGSSISFE
jgi:hypothetical protein